MGRFVTPDHQEFDSNGDPLTGGKLYFYSTGTLVAKDTFSDDAMTSANANPVVADAAGRFGDIFLESGDYRVILKDTDDVEIWDHDPISGSVGSSGAVDEKTADYTVTLSDSTKLLVFDATSAAITVTFLAAATAGDGFELSVKKSDASANAVTLDGNASETIDGAATFVLGNRYDTVTLRSDGTNWQIISRRLAPMTTAEAQAKTATLDRLITPAVLNAGAVQAVNDLAVIMGLHSFWVPAVAMIARTTNGAAIGTTETSTNKHMIRTLDFDASTDEFVQFTVRMPKSWNAGTVTAEFVWSHAAATTYGVRFFIQGLSSADDEALDTAFGTAVGHTADTGGTTDDLYVTATTAAITIAGAGKSEFVTFQIYRDVSDAGDTLDVDARLHGVTIFYTNDAGDDT